MQLQNPVGQVGSIVGTLAVVTTIAFPQQDSNQSAEQREQPQRELRNGSSIDSQALRLIELVGESVESSQSFTSLVVYTFEVRGPADSDSSGIENITERSISELAFAQPNMLRLEHKEGSAGETIMSDGQTLSLYLPRRNQYLQQDAPSELRGLMEQPGAAMAAPAGLGGPLSFVGMILVPEMFDGLRPLIRRATIEGAEQVEGVRAQRINMAVAFPQLAPGAGSDPAQQQTDEWEASPQEDAPAAATPNEQLTSEQPDRAPELIMTLWIEEREDRAVLRQMHIDLARLLEGHSAVPPELGDFEIDITIAMTDWEFDVELPDETFVFTPPEGAEQVASLRELASVSGAAPGEHPLIGQPAPEFELQRLQGSVVQLSEHLGRDIVVLDFWATWCTPCIRAMPQLMSVTDEFRNDNVVLYAINLREDYDHVHEFAQQRDWLGRLMIPMDIDGSVAQQYGVESIPHTVIIGIDGRVQQVDIGLGPGMEQQLRSELQTLVDGGSLIEDAEEGEGDSADSDDD